ncbi:MAG: 2-dehydropantoate 2-reductase [Candidatus Thermoplasmatota archaeon]
MRIAVLGAGALGSLLGALLSLKHEVLLIGREAHVHAIRTSGLRIEGRTKLLVHPEAATSCSGLGAVDLLVLSVKSYDTEEALGSAAPLFGRGTTLLTLQNGPRSAERAARIVGEERVLAGWTSHGATFVAPGVVHHTGAGDTAIGEMGGGVGERARAAAEALESGGITVRISREIHPELWMKCVVNAAINPLTALLGCRNGVLAEREETRVMVRTICSEGADVLDAMGWRCDAKALEERVWRVVAQTADNTSSMLQDAQRGRRTEIDDITGALCTAAQEHEIPVPANLILWQLVRALGCKEQRA